MPKRRISFSPVGWPVVVAMGVVLLAAWSPGARPRNEEARHPAGADPAAGCRDTSAPSLLPGEGRGLPDAGLRPERITLRTAASRGIEPATGHPQPAEPARRPRPVAGRPPNSGYTAAPARTSLHALHCVWLT